MITISTEHKPNNETVTVSGSLTVEHAAEVKAALQEALQQNAEHVVLSLGTISQADLSFFQVVCAAHKAATLSGKTFGIEPSKQGPLMQSHRSLGFSRRVGCNLDTTKSCVFMLMSM